MSIESEILSEIEGLRGRFPETRALYREVCALLFFRYGIAPTASKLYQYVRKGSMNVPAEALAKFWDDLRTKARIEIDHPDLPDEVKGAAAEAIGTIWRQATAAARLELQALRDDVASQIASAISDAQASAAMAADRLQQLEAIRAELLEHQASLNAARADHEAERRSHTATAARNQELQRQVADLKADQEAARSAFTAELDKARVAVDEAVERAAASERRALLTVDEERQARRKVEQQADGLRNQLGQFEIKARDQAVVHAESTGRLRAQVDALQLANQELTETNRRLHSQLETTTADRDEAREERVRLRAEVDATRTALDRLAPPATAQTRPSRTKR